MMDTEMNKIFPKRIQLVLLSLLFMLCVIIGILISFLIETESGFSIRSAGADELTENRWTLRIMLMVSNATMFLLPGILFSIILFRKNWLKSVKAHIFPSFSSTVVSSVAIGSSVGLIAYAFHLNQMLPLPEWMIESEKENQGLVSAALMMESPIELLACLVIVALIPAIGEEWIFRGILQKRLNEWINNEHLAVWIMAIIFSAIHMQFQGFFPRMILGAMLGYMFYWSGSLWLPIIAHFFNNALQVVLYYVSLQNGEAMDISENPEVVWWQALLSTIIVVGLMFLLRNMNRKTAIES